MNTEWCPYPLSYHMRGVTVLSYHLWKTVRERRNSFMWNDKTRSLEPVVPTQLAAAYRSISVLTQRQFPNVTVQRWCWFGMWAIFLLPKWITAGQHIITICNSSYCAVDPMYDSDCIIFSGTNSCSYCRQTLGGITCEAFTCTTAAWIKTTPCGGFAASPETSRAKGGSCRETKNLWPTMKIWLHLVFVEYQQFVPTKDIQQVLQHHHVKFLILNAAKNCDFEMTRLYSTQFF